MESGSKLKQNHSCALYYNILLNLAILIIQNFRGLFIFSFLLLSPPQSSVHSAHFVHSVFIIRIICVIRSSVH